jgi:hypothetical protein
LASVLEDFETLSVQDHLAQDQFDSDSWSRQMLLNPLHQDVIFIKSLLSQRLEEGGGETLLEVGIEGISLLSFASNFA